MAHPKDALTERVALLRGWRQYGAGDPERLYWASPSGESYLSHPPPIGWPLAGELLEEIAAAGLRAELHLSPGVAFCDILDAFLHIVGGGSNDGDLPAAIAEAWIQWRGDQDG